MRTFVLIISFFSFGFEIFAQNLQDTVVKIDEVKIIDKKIFRKRGNLIIYTETIKIDSQIIAQNNSKTLSELLQNKSNIFIKSYGKGSSATASIRGAAASQTQVLWNDIPINNPMLGQADLSLVPVYFTDKIEIFSGSNSLNSVSGALGGSIELKTIPETEKFNTTINANYGSFNTFQIFAKVAGKNANTGNSLKLFYEKSDNNFTFINTATGKNNLEKQKNAEFSGSGILNETTYQISGNKSLNFKIWLQKNNRNIPPIMSFQGSDRKEYKNDNILRSIISYKTERRKYESDFSLSYVYETLNYFLADLINTDFSERINSESKINRAEIKYSAILYPLKNLVVKAKFLSNLQKAKYFDEISSVNYGATRQVNDLFLSLNYKINSRIFSNTLFRINNTDLKFLPVMFSEKIEYAPVKNSSLKFSYSFGRNFHNPSLNDLYWIPGGNPDLLPEDAYTNDFNIFYDIKKNNNFKAEVKTSIYASLINNQIIWQPGEFGYWFAQNIQKVFSRGLENTVSVKYNFGNIKFITVAGYSYTKATDRSTKNENDISYGKQLIYTPLHKAYIFLNTEYSNWIFNISNRYTGQRYTDFTQENINNILPAFDLTDISIIKKFSFKKFKLETKIGINNIFNIRYQEILWRAMPGRNYLLSFGFNFHKW